MSTQQAVAYKPSHVPLLKRVTVYALVLVARLLAKQPPQRIAKILRLVRRGAVPASLQTAAWARDSVVEVSLLCAGREGCLPRSLATALMCRVRGQWPVWCVGVRRLPPFYAHAWVEVDGVPVGEGYPADYFRPLLSVS